MVRSPLFLRSSREWSPFGGANMITALCSAHLAYFFVFEALWSRTPGKYLFGLRVCQLDGSRCTLRSAMLRTLLRVIEVNPLLFGALPAGIVLLITERKQRLGDILAGTVVISNKILPGTAVNDNK